MIDTIKSVAIIGLGVCGGILLSDYIKKNISVELEKETSNGKIRRKEDYMNKMIDNVTDNNNQLGDHITEEQSANIGNGSFTDLPIGSYWIIHGVNFRIMAHDQFYGYNGIDTHHVVVMPDSLHSTQIYNITNTNRGGYYNSELKKYIEDTYNPYITSIFGLNHVLSHTHDLTDGTADNGKLVSTANTIAWLVNSYNVNGSKCEFETSYSWQNADKIQFPAFKNDSNLKIAKHNRLVNWWWLGSSGSFDSTCFCIIEYSGDMDADGASYSYGIRPAFLVY